MQGKKAGVRIGRRLKSRGCRALCCTTCSRISVSSEGESFGADHYASVSSLGHYMVQERLAQLIKHCDHEDRPRSQCGSTPTPNICSLTTPNKERCILCEGEDKQYRSQRCKISGGPDLSNFYEEDRARKLIDARKGKQKRTVKNGATSTTSRSNSSRRLALMVAIEKSSGDPRGDFRQSMVEVILANQIEQPKDLRCLLDCYLSMNSKEYKEVILEVFHEVCSDIFLCC